MRIKSKAIRFSAIASVMVCASLFIPREARAQDDVLPPPPPPTARGSGTGSIVGRVVLPSGQPVNDRVRITLSTIRDPDLTVYTDNNGGFGFGGLPEATYTLEVAGDPKLYETVTQEVRLLRGMQVRLVINLKERNPSPKANTGAVISAAELDPNVPAQAKKEYDKATKLAAEGRLQEAIEQYKKAVQIYSKYLMAINDLGVQYLKLKRYPEAAEQFETAVEINPKAFNPRLNLGIALVEQKKFADALDHLRLASSIDNSSASVHLYLGIALVGTEESEAAEQELTKALSIGGAQFSVAHYFLAHVHMKKGEREEAVRELKTYLQIEPTGEYAARAKTLLEELK
ncbi:MAG TPA: tetratricopeptide repeat protein [Blastocatellia bacterium]|nr:tetratricopeptide repeat protein [Blastocatellia bacterium]